MARATAAVIIKVAANSYEFNRAMETVSKKVQNIGRDMQRVGKNMSLYFTAPMAAIAGASVKLYDAQARAEAKVEQAIKSTAGAARLSFEQLKSFASELQGKTIFGDEEILNKSTAQLLTFTNIAGENFKRAQTAALDLSTVLDGDLQSASMQLGKALNDPVRSLSALRRSGIQFSVEQETVIKKLAQTGQIAKAQALMLDELERQYGGQAKKRAQEGAGALIQLKNKWSDFLEQIGKAIMPALNALARKLSGVVDWLSGLSPATKNAVISFLGFIAVVGPSVLIVGKLITTIKALQVLFSTTTVGAVVTVIVAAGAAMAALIGYTRDCTREMGANEKAVSQETKQVNILASRLTSANTKEDDRKRILSELVKISPSILTSISNEALGYETLRQNLKKFNEEQVRKLALAKLTDKESSLLGNLGDIEAGKIEATESALTKIYEINNKIKNGEIKGFGGSSSFIDNLLVSEKLSDYEKIQAFRKNLDLSNSPYLDVNQFLNSYRTLEDLQGRTQPIQKELEVLQQTISKTEKSVTDQLKTALGDSSDVDDVVKQISDINSKISELQTVRQSTTDNQIIAAIDAQISSLQSKIKALKTGSLIDADNVTEATGLIAQLGAQIEKLESKKANANSVADIAALNSQIAALKTQVDNLNGVTSEYLALRAQMANGLGFTAPAMVMPQIKAQDIMTNSVKINPISKWITDTQEIRKSINDFAISVYSETENALKAVSLAEKLSNAINKQLIINPKLDFKDAASKIINQYQKFASGLGDVLTQSIKTAFVGFGETLGGIMAGDLGLSDLVSFFVSTIGKFLVEIGTYLIMTADIMVGIKESISALFSNPWIAIAVGVGAIALGVLLQSVATKKIGSSVPKLAQGGLAYGPTYAMVGDNVGARVDPEVIAPLSKLKGIMGSGGSTNINMQISGKLTASGRDLALQLSNENYKLQVMGR